jgi:hypothetical protein
MRKKKPQTTPKPTGRVFSTNLARPHLSYAAALQGQENQPPQEAPASTAAITPQAPTSNPSIRKTGQSVQAPSVNSDSLNMHMGRAITITQQIITECNDAASEKEKFLRIAAIVFDLMNLNGK